MTGRRRQVPVRASCPVCGHDDGVFIRRFGLLVCRSCLDRELPPAPTRDEHGRRRLRLFFHHLHIGPVSVAAV